MAYPYIHNSDTAQQRNTARSGILLIAKGNYKIIISRLFIHICAHTFAFTHSLIGRFYNICIYFILLCWMINVKAIYHSAAFISSLFWVILYLIMVYPCSSTPSVYLPSNWMKAGRVFFTKLRWNSSLVGDMLLVWGSSISKHLRWTLFGTHALSTFRSSSISAC